MLVIVLKSLSCGLTKLTMMQRNVYKLDLFGPLFYLMKAQCQYFTSMIMAQDLEAEQTHTSVFGDSDEWLNCQHFTFQTKSWGP